MGRDIFEKLREKQPPEIIPPAPANLRTSLAGRLLNWLLNYWDADTISAKQIYTFGPRPIKNSKEAINAAEILVQRGWLIPTRTHRIDRRMWRIIRENKPTEISHVNKTADDSRPTVTSHF